jgi:Xaa-Pro aminopeptidase
MSDIIRMIGVGDLSPDAERHAELASAANAAMRAAVRPGVRVSEVYEAGRQPYDDAGVGAGAGALFGHGIGMEVWERPFIRRHDDPGENIALRPGMTLCLEPILMPMDASGAVAGVFVFEEQVAVTADGHELLSDGLATTLWRAPG